MKSVGVVVILALALAPASASVTNPIAKVISMVSDLQAKVIAEGESMQKTYAEFSEYCEDRSKELAYEIKTGGASIEDLKATIGKATADSEQFNAKIEETAGTVAAAEADLKAATGVREKEAADFALEEKDLADTIDTLGRAIVAVEKQKGSASLMQVQNAKSLEQALSALVQASAFSSADASRLTALVQSSDSSDDEEMGAPAAAAYESHSGGIVEILEGLNEKAEAQLDATRKAETSSRQNFEMLKGSLQDAIKFGGKDLDKAKKDLAAAAETKATAEGDLSVTSKDLADGESTLSTMHHDCMEKANTFEEEGKARKEELTALATAKKIIQEATGGAASQSYSLLQVEASQPSNAGFAAVHFVRRLAQKQNSPALAQLASRMASAVRGGSNEDVFGKVKDLIRNMIEKLNEDAQGDATKKAYCDKELSESNAKKEDKTAEVEKLSTKIDLMTATSSKLREEVAVLQKELAALAKSQAEMDRIRMEEKSAFSTNSAEMKKGVEGIQLALKVLREYYAQGDSTASSDAGGGIISMLEVCESDFTKDLSEMTAAESMAAADYKKESQANTIDKAMKNQDVKYKSKESKGLDQSVAEHTSDRSGVQEELDAVNEYLKKLADQCVEKAATYGENKARREAEIAGLKEALSILEGEAVLLQKTDKMASLRGKHHHVSRHA